MDDFADDQDLLLAEDFDDPVDALTGDVELRPEPEDNGARLDRFVADCLPDFSRATVQSLIEEGRVLVDGQSRKAKFKVTAGQVINVSIPEPTPEAILPEAIPLSIVYEDRDVLIIDKPAGMVVHPAPGHPNGTLVNAVVHHAPEIAIAGTNRPGIIHRLDKDTSGLIVIAKTDRARSSLVPQWESRTVRKTYLALVNGVVGPDEGTIDAPIGRDPVHRQRMAVMRSGRSAVSHFKVLERFAESTLVEVTIETGRTHQIRVHMQFAGHPVIGDPVYGRKMKVQGIEVDRQFLHASGLALTLPDGRAVEFSTPLPRDLAIILDHLRQPSST